MNTALDERLRLAFPPRRALTVKGAEPGATITFEDGALTRAGVVIDRAALITFRTVNDWTPARGYEPREISEEIPGTYLWVMPDTGDADRGGCVMVQTWQSGRNVGRFIRVQPAWKAQR